MNKVNKLDLELFTGRKYFYAVGRRKTSIARVRLYPDGTGKVFINGQKLVDLKNITAEMAEVFLQPLDAVSVRKSCDFSVNVSGGGKYSQIDAIRHGLARALVVLDPAHRSVIKKLGFLTRDPRMKERKKFGLRRARRAPQWSKR